MARHSIEKTRVRRQLEPQREPYWGARLARGLYMGVRKLETGECTWIARQRMDGRQRYQSFGYADSTAYDDAVVLARKWSKTLQDGIDTSDVQTVADACREYVVDRRREKGDATAYDAEGRFRRHVYDHPIGKVKLAKLRAAQLKEWRAKLEGATSSINRDLSTLKAALNYAVASRYVDAGRSIEWHNVKPEHTTARRDLYLDRDQRHALVDALPDHVKPFVRGLCLLPLRPGALAWCEVRDFDAKRATLKINHDKAAAGRIIALSPAAVELLRKEARSKLPSAPLIAYMDGSAWSRFRWRDPIQRAALAADLPQGTCAYTLRHSVITDMLAGGMDTLTVAKIAGTSLTMIEKHYGHLLHKHAADAMARLAL